MDAPAERAKKIKENSIKQLKRYLAYFDTYKDVKIANICGLCRKKAVPFALLGADVTAFDISEDNKKYVSELADAARMHINYGGMRRFGNR